MPINPEVRQRLKEKGLRATPQRLLVLQILEDAVGHMYAEQIWKRAQEHDENLSLATVYRALNTLKEQDLVEQRYFARDHKREYFETPTRGEHYHFTCLDCGEVTVLQSSRINQARQELSAEHSLVFTHACVCFEGYCARCAEQLR